MAFSEPSGLTQYPGVHKLLQKMPVTWNLTLTDERGDARALERFNSTSQRSASSLSALMTRGSH